jgi:endonuclease/exonuclease/phosphatase (EEP) superfamily protein YafD
MQPNLRLTWPGLVAAASVLACIATVTGFAGRLWWVFELTCHFRAQYAIALGLGALTMLAGRRARWAVVFAAFALLDAALVAPRFLTGAEAAAGGDAPAFRALLANVNSDNRDYPRIRRTIADRDPDFIVLLEVTPWLLDRLADLADRYPQRAAAPREDPFGIALLSRRPFLKVEVIQLGAAGLPSIEAEFAAGGQRFTLLATHSPPPISAGTARERNDQLAALARFARQRERPLLVLGDLNVTPWSPYLRDLLAGSGLRDSASGRGIQPSWPAGWLPLWIPIDHALFSEGIRIRHREIGPALGSDHYPVIVDFQVSGP